MDRTKWLAPPWNVRPGPPVVEEAWVGPSSQTNGTQYHSVAYMFMTGLLSGYGSERYGSVVHLAPVKI